MQQRHRVGIAVGLHRALYHGDVDAVAPEIGLAPVDRGDPNLDFGMKCCKPAEARHQPPDRERRGCGYGEDADPPSAAHSFAREEHAVEPGPYAFEQGLPVRRQLDRAMSPLKKPRADVLLERPYLVADSTLGQSELIRRAGKREVPCHGLEGT